MPYFSKSTGGFYDAEDHGEPILTDGTRNPDTKIPDDAVEISNDLRNALLTAESGGKMIAADASGMPVAVDRPQPSVEEVWSRVRTQRNRLLAETDFGRDTPDSVVKKFTKYRQDLRDVPQTFAADPSKIIWPTKPE